jgi:uncharacterized protein (DUF4213/DUF364 family)
MAYAISHPSPSSDETITALVEGTRHLVEEKSEHELHVAVQLQAAARGFLVRHTTRKIRAAINPAPSTIPSTASLGVATVQPVLTMGRVVPTSGRR